MFLSIQKAVSALLVMAGLYLIAFGGAWAPFVLDALPESDPGLWIELIVPFLPMAIIGLGALLYTTRVKK